MRPLHTSLNTAYSGQGANQAHPCHLLHILSMSSYPCPHLSPLPPPHFYSRHPIISVFTFHMPKPPQSTMPHQFCHALNTQKTVQDLTSLPILQRHTTHPSMDMDMINDLPWVAEKQRHWTSEMVSTSDYQIKAYNYFLLLLLNRKWKIQSNLNISQFCTLNYSYIIINEAAWYICNPADVPTVVALWKQQWGLEIWRVWGKCFCRGPRKKSSLETEQI